MAQPGIHPLVLLQQKVMKDEICRRLLLEYETANQRLVEQIPSMPPEQRDAVMDYIGALGELHRRVLALASGEAGPYDCLPRFIPGKQKSG